MEKVYNVYFTDAPNDPVKVRCANKTQARAEGRLYIKQWNLKAKIDRIEEAA